MSHEPTIYLLHFERSYKHARHYLGYTENLEQRLQQHRAGLGSPLVAAAIADGISFQLAATWPGSRRDERRLHDQKNSPARLCLLCRAELRRQSPAAPVGPSPDDCVDAVLIAGLTELSGPVTLPALHAHLRRRGRRVGSLYARLAVLAATGRITRT